MSDPHPIAPIKPRKPYPEFPLTPHPSGRWCKNYFGPWADPNRAT